MNKETNRAGLGIALSLLLVLGAGQARALNVLTFDTGNPERNEVVGALGFSMTRVGASGVAALDFSQFDVIYVAQSYEEFFGSSLLWSLGARAGDLQAFVSNGGGLVFGSPAAGINLDLNAAGGILPSLPSHPVTDGVNLSGLTLGGLPAVPFLDPIAADGGNPVLLAGGLGDGRLVTWNPGEVGLITDASLQLVGNSIQWAAGGTPAVPEPGTFALFGLGAASLLFLRRRKNSKA